MKCRVLKSGNCEITQWYHKGIDIVGGGYTLDSIIAHSDGTVIGIAKGRENNPNATNMESYGNYVLLNHSNGWCTMYAHLQNGSNNHLNIGDNILKGTVLGYMGNTGHSFGGHLHFEVRTDKSYASNIDGEPYLNADIVPTLPNKSKPIERNTKVNQLQIVYNSLNIRLGAGKGNQSLGFAEMGFYNYYETKENDGLVWYRISDIEWVAFIDGCLNVLPKVEEPIIVEPTIPENTDLNGSTDTKEEDSVNTLPNTENTDTVPLNDKKESDTVKQKSKTQKILDFILLIFNLIKKFTKKN